MLREMFPGIAPRICMSALDHAGGDMNVAAGDISTRYPHGFGLFASPSPSPQMAQASGNVKKETAGPSTRPVNGPRIKLNVRRNYSPVNVEIETRSRSPEVGQARNIFEPPNGDVSTRSTSPFEEDSDIDMDSDFDQEGSDDEPENPIDEAEDTIDDPENIVDDSEDSADAKARELHVIFPGADLEECKRILQCADGNLTEAVDMMEEERGGDLFGDTVMSGNSVGGSSSADASSYRDSSKSSHSTSSVNGGGSDKKRAAEDSVSLLPIFNSRVS